MLKFFLLLLLPFFAAAEIDLSVYEKGLYSPHGEDGILATLFAQLQTELSRTEDQLAFARQYYNDACATLNSTMVTIPWSLFAGMSGVSKGEFYDAPDASSAPPQVSF